MSAPPLQRVVPGVQTPSELPQVSPPPGSPSSMFMSQSLSMPSQISARPPVSPTHTKVPVDRSQVSTPGLHSPTSLPQAPPVGTDSSTLPSQSSSAPLQVSAVPPVAPSQIRLPPMQRSVPGMQAPVLEPQEVPGSVPSSTLPLQSSSRVLQISAEGPTAPTQVLVSKLPPTQR